jgi:hypothetical protein
MSLIVIPESGAIVGIIPFITNKLKPKGGVRRAIRTVIT